MATAKLNNAVVVTFHGVKISMDVVENLRCAKYAEVTALLKGLSTSEFFGKL